MFPTFPRPPAPRSAAGYLLRPHIFHVPIRRGLLVTALAPYLFFRHLPPSPCLTVSLSFFLFRFCPLLPPSFFFFLFVSFSVNQPTWIGFLRSESPLRLGALSGHSRVWVQFFFFFRVFLSIGFSRALLRFRGRKHLCPHSP